MIFKFSGYGEYSSLEEFCEEFSNVTIDEIDGVMVISVCEICGEPVLETQSRIGDGPTAVHTKCEEEDGYNC